VQPKLGVVINKPTLQAARGQPQGRKQQAPKATVTSAT
jgi:hypothetical protein